MKYIMKRKENLINLSEGYIDTTTLKTVELGFVDMLLVPKQTLSAINSCFEVFYHICKDPGINISSSRFSTSS